MNKPKRRLKSSVRKTAGALFLATSVVVAAIPTGSIRGGDTEAATFTDAPDYHMRYELGKPAALKATDSRKAPTTTLLTSTSTSVPFIKNLAGNESDDINDITVYTSEDSLYQFAYVSQNGIQAEDTNEKYAFILKYNTPGSLPGGQLVIPETVDAYLAYNTNDGTSSAANCAVGKSGNYLFYKEEQKVIEYDVSNNETGFHMEYAYRPCYASTHSEWAKFSDDQLYWFDTADFRPTSSTDFSENEPDHLKQVGSDQSHQRITNAPVRYIANQYIYTGADSKTHIAKITDSSQGIFNGNGNITTLITGDNLNGIGDYAFYACSGLSHFKFSNGLSAIGNHAFEYCSSLSNIEIPSNTNLQVIGAYAFKNCTSLTSFRVPTSVVLLCDGVFQNCISMTDCVLSGDSVTSSQLRYLGNGVFYNCQNLTELEFPTMFTEKDVNISNFLQCYGLSKLVTNNTEMDFIDDAEEGEDYCGGDDGVVFTFAEFIDNITPNFYMVGVEIGNAAQESPESKWGNVHKTCKEKQIAYNYSGTDYYEKTITEEGTGTATYLVDGTNNLRNCNIEGTVYTLTFPEYIGPNYIAAIGDGAFKDICTLVMVTLPSTIESIGAEAFKGCHNLQYVYFENDDVLIGKDAFKTQDTTAHTNCSTHEELIAGRSFKLYSSADMTTASNKPAVQLYFVGTIDSSARPYQYAMSFDGRFNNGSQSPAFARFLSGYPTCQEIAFVLDDAYGNTGKATLVDFPVLTDTLYLSSATNTKTSYLTVDQKNAIAEAAAKVATNEATEDQIAFYNATQNLVVPLGVDAIDNGLFYRKTNGTTNKLSVTLYGIDNVEADYTANDPATAADDNGDVCPPEVTLNTKNIVYEKYTADGTESATMNDVPDSDFAGCTNLTKLTLMGSNTKNLSDGAFYGCTSLEEVEALCPVDRFGQECFGGDTALKSFSTTNTVGTIGDHCCTGATALETVSITGDINSIEKHAFEDCTNLRDVSIDDSLSSVGIAPFRGCSSLSNVEMNSNPNFVCDNSIIYGTDGNGNKKTLIECLAGRSKAKVDPTETEGVTDILEEAFAETNVEFIDLSKSSISSIPKNCFEDTADLYTIQFPYTTRNIAPYAFDGSGVKYIEATQYMNFRENSFDHMLKTGWDPATKTGDHTNNKAVTMIAPSDSFFYQDAEAAGYTVEEAPKEEYFDVKFFDYTDASPDSYVQVGETQSVLAGNDAKPPTPHGKTGYVFKEWSPSYECITDNTSCYAVYETEPDDYNKYTVTFYYDDSYTDLLKTVYIESGKSAASEAPLSEVLAKLPEGMNFRGWKGGDINNITANTRFYADISEVPSGYWKVMYYSFDGSTLLYTTNVKDGEDAPSYQGPAIDGYVFTGWSGVLTNITKDTVTLAQYKKADGSDVDPGTVPKPGTGGSETSGDSSSKTDAKYYTLTVVNGSGSGSYIAGANVVIIANDPDKNKQFGSWSISPASTPIASKVLSATVVTMPSEAVTVTANYVASTSNNNNNNNNNRGSGSGTNNAAGNYWPSTGNVPKSSGTTVVIDKNGLSNTGVVSATVNGSTDNFMIKVTESATADKAVLDALVKKYGSLDNIIYFPMDISLYNAAGTTQITDTSGLTITITLPLPDSMNQYGANNQVAYVVNGELDGLNPKFTTINGVPCVTFTCTHFSPYVIYVNTVSMTAGSDNSGTGTGLDNTPKTADPIHPKWFVAIALFAISIVLFLMKDKKPVKAVANGGSERKRT